MPLLLKSQLRCPCFTVLPTMMLIQAMEAETVSTELTAVILQYVQNSFLRWSSIVSVLASAMHIAMEQCLQHHGVV